MFELNALTAFGSVHPGGHVSKDGKGINSILWQLWKRVNLNETKAFILRTLVRFPHQF